jgi:hypothetical protein
VQLILVTTRICGFYLELASLVWRIFVKDSPWIKFWHEILEGMYDFYNPLILYCNVSRFSVVGVFGSLHCKCKVEVS